MRAILPAWLIALTSCATPTVATPYAEGEQIMVAIRSCIPGWIPLAPIAVPVSGDGAFAIQVAPSTFDLEASEIACVLAAGSECAAVRSCFGIELFADDRCSAPSAACEGEVGSGCFVDGLLYCGAGQDQVSYDCIAHGFGPCELDGVPSDHRPAAGPSDDASSDARVVDRAAWTPFSSMVFVVPSASTAARSRACGRTISQVA